MGCLKIYLKDRLIASKTDVEILTTMSGAVAAVNF
jgi:hypothetical protein